MTFLRRSLLLDGRSANIRPWNNQRFRWLLPSSIHTGRNISRYEILDWLDKDPTRERLASTMEFFKAMKSEVRKQVQENQWGIERVTKKLQVLGQYAVQGKDGDTDAFRKEYENLNVLRQGLEEAETEFQKMVRRLNDRSIWIRNYARIVEGASGREEQLLRLRTKKNQDVIQRTKRSKEQFRYVCLICRPDHPFSDASGLRRHLVSKDHILKEAKLNSQSKGSATK